MKLVAACPAVLLLAACAGSPPPDDDGSVTIDRIVAIADADHAASTYVDGILAAPGGRDQLVTMSIVDGQVNTASVDVSNSVTAAPEVLALHPDGQVAFVAERLASRRDGDIRADQLAPGTALTAVDVSNLTAPQVLAGAAVPQLPEALAVSADGGRIAVVSNPPDGAVLTLFDWDGASFAAPTSIPLPDVELATNVQWHPDGDALAINDDRGDRVVFARLDQNMLQPWGSAVSVGVDPFVGRFTPDGRHYIPANWGRDLSTSVAADRLPDEPSTLSVVELGETDHRVVAEAESDVSSEGLAISPDGTDVATVNMRGTVFPADSPKFDEQASVSLFRLGDDGSLAKIGDHSLTAVLPDGGTFDRTGEYFIATSFQGRGDDGGSGLQVFRVDDAAGLVPVQRVSLPRGVHHVVV